MLPNRWITSLQFALVLAFQANAAFAADLQEAWQAAQAHDPSLASARFMRDSAAENIAIAQARLRPQVSLASTQQHVEQRTQNALGASDFSGRSANTQLTLRQTILRQRDRLGTDVARLQAQIGQFRWDVARSEVFGRTANAWVDVLAAHALRDVYARSLPAAQSAAQQERQRLERGDGTRDAAAEAQAQLVQAQASLADAEQNLSIRQQAFSQLTRMRASGFEAYRIAQARNVMLPLATQEQAIDGVLKGNPELETLRLNERLNERKLAQAGADHWPTLDVIGSISRAKNDATNTLGSRYGNHQLGLQWVLPIYSGGALDAGQRQAASQYASSSSELLAFEYKLRDLVSMQWHTISGLRQRIDASEQLILAAKELRRGAELGLRNGLKTWVDVSAAQQLLARREVDQLGLITALLKSQILILSLLPADDPMTQQWARLLNSAVL